MSYLKEIHLIGLALPFKTTNEDDQAGIDCGNLWQKFEKEGHAGQIPNKVSDTIYAVSIMIMRAIILRLIPTLLVARLNQEQ